MIAPMPEDEQQRLLSLAHYNIIGSEPEQVFDDLTLLAARVLRAPYSALTFVAADVQWFKSTYGASFKPLPRGETFCARTVVNRLECTVVGDALGDSSSRELGLVCSPPHIRSYIGAPLVTPDFQAIGTLCVLDTRPREFTTDDRELLRTLARQAVSQLELRRQAALLSAANEKLQMLATCDSLTGLKNFRALQDSVDDELVFALRNKTPLSVLLLDVDSFKDYNDHYGHPAGDEILQAISILLIESSREYDVVARYGGEEFAVVLRNADGAEAMSVAERIRSRIAGANWPLRPITASIGAATTVSGAATRDSLIGEADRLLYRAKQDGKNRVVAGQIDSSIAQIVWGVGHERTPVDVANESMRMRNM